MKHVGICAGCGRKTAYPFACRVREFCSHACSNQVKAEKKKAEAEKATLTCEHCRRPFTLLASTVKSREKATGNPIRFCSRSCYNAGVAVPEPPRRSRAVAMRARKRRPVKKTPEELAAQRRQYHRAYVARNRGRINELARAWRKANRAYRNFIQQQRRAAGTLTYDEWRAIINATGKCAQCSATERLEVDHVKPIKHGGRTEKGNLQVLCRTCNARKGSQLTCVGV